MVSGSDAIIVGAGLAGLAAARALSAAGRDVLVLEAADRPGGRLRTDVVDGFTVDHGFQVLNSAYPELQRLGPLAGRDRARFDRGALLRHGHSLHRVLDPRQAPLATLGDLTAPVGSLREKAALAAFVAACAYAPPDRIRGRRDVAFRDQLRAWHLDGTVTDRFVRPFLSGVLLEDELTTSARFVDLVWRTFVRGEVYVPRLGIQAFPEALAAALPDGTIRYGCRVGAVRPGQVDTDEGTLHTAAVVVAVDPRTAAAWLGRRGPAMQDVTTVWHAAPSAPTADKLIVLDSDGGPVVNSVVMSNVSAGYSPDARALVASSYLGVGTLADADLRTHLTRLWGREVSDWETVARSEVRGALPALPGGSPLQRSVTVAPGLFVAGDWRDTPSTQGALVSGRRAARAVLAVQTAG